MLDDDDYKRPVSLTDWDYSCYVPLLIPVILFLVSFYIRPTIQVDSGFGFLALRSMLEGMALTWSPNQMLANIAK